MDPAAGNGMGREDAEREYRSTPGERNSHTGELEAEAMRHLDALYTLGLRLSRERSAAEALVSETILHALERWEQYRLVPDVRTWLFTLLSRLYSRQTSGQAESARAPLPRSAENPAGWSAYQTIGHSDPGGRFYDAFLDEQITRAIDELPYEYRSAVMLRDLLGLRYVEVAEVMGVPEATVRSRLELGRRSLQRKLVSYALEMGYLRAPTGTTA